MPLGGNSGFHRGQIVEPRQGPPPSAVGTAAAMLRPRRHHRLIEVAFLTGPPYFPVAVGRHGFRRQAAVLFSVPLPGDVRVERFQIVLAGQHGFSRADRAARAVGRPGKDRRLPFMPFFTAPPDFPVASRRHIPGRQGAVSDGMPLLCQIGAGGRQIVFFLHDGAVGAHRTAAAGRSGVYPGHPLVPFFAAPPNHPVTAGHNISRRKGQIFCGVPFLCQVRKQRPQIGFPRGCLLPDTVRAATPRGGAGMEIALPLVPLFTPPPHPPAAAPAHRVRRQRLVFVGMPLAEQLLAVCAQAICPQ